MFWFHAITIIMQDRPWSSSLTSANVAAERQGVRSAMIPTHALCLLVQSKRSGRKALTR